MVPKNTLTCCRVRAQIETFRQTYNEGARVSWGGGIMGPKSNAKTKKREKQVAKEADRRTT